MQIYSLQKSFAKRGKIIGVADNIIDEDLKRQTFSLACKRFESNIIWTIKLTKKSANIQVAYGLIGQKIVVNIIGSVKNVKTFDEFSVKMRAQCFEI